MATQPGFVYNYTPMDYATAQKQALAQLDPLYQQSVKGVQDQQYQNQVASGNQSAARGLGHSGLAQDQLTKIAIASQSQIAGLNAQRMTQANTMAQSMVDNDKQYDLQRRSQMYGEYASNRDYQYGVSRDAVADKQWQTQFDYGKSRDAVSDKQWKQEYDYRKSTDDRNYNYQVKRDARQDYVTDREWNNMSPAEKQRMAQQFAYSQKGGKGGGGGGRKGGKRGTKGSTTNGYLPYAPGNQPITYEEYLKMVQSGGYTASSNYGRGNGKVQKGPGPESKKAHPIRY